MLDFTSKAMTICCAKTAASPATSRMPACPPALFFLEDPRLKLAERSKTLCLNYPVGEKLSSKAQGIWQSINHKTNVHCKLRQNQPGRKLQSPNISCVINRSSCLVQREMTKKQQDIPYLVATETPSMNLEEARTVIVSYIL